MIIKEDIEKIRTHLHRQGKDSLAELLRNSTSQLDVSPYESYPLVLHRTFKIYSPPEVNDKLKKLSDDEKRAIHDIVCQLYPPKSERPEIVNLEFYDNYKSEGDILAFCANCGTSQGLFLSIDDLYKKIAMQNKCANCGVDFSFSRSDDRIWNIDWKIILSKEEYIVKLLEEMEQQKTQTIFCYEDLSKNSRQYRYPPKKITFHWYEKTERASPAYALHIYDKSNINDIEKCYFFDAPYSILQLVREGIKGYKWLKYGKKV